MIVAPPPTTMFGKPQAAGMDIDADVVPVTLPKSMTSADPVGALMLTPTPADELMVPALISSILAAVAVRFTAGPTWR